MALSIKNLELFDVSSGKIYKVDDTGTNVDVNVGNSFIQFTPSGSININSSPLNLSNGIIYSVSSIDSQNNQNLTINKTSGNIKFTENSDDLYTITSNSSTFNRIPTLNYIANDTIPTQIVNYNNFLNYNTYNPVFVAGTSGTPTTDTGASKGMYMKVGNLIFFACIATLSNINTAVGQVKVTLPLALSFSASHIQNFMVARYSGFNAATNVGVVNAYIQSNDMTTFVVAIKSNATATSISAVSYTALTNTFSISVSGVYYDY